MNVFRAISPLPGLSAGLFLTLGLLANTAHANKDTEEKEMRYYDVELIIVENLRESARKSENWPVNIKLEQAEKTIQYGEPVITEMLPEGVDPLEGYKVLPADTYRLTEHVEKISEAENQRVIFHASWRQPGLSNDDSLPVHFTHEVPAPPKTEENTNNQVQLTPDVNTDVETPVFEIKPATLEGILRVTLSRYLHLEAELSLRNKLDDENNAESGSESQQVDTENPFAALDQEAKEKAKQAALQKQQVIYLKQKRRRMRSKEIHYIDHPVLSILVLMTPYEKTRRK